MNGISDHVDPIKQLVFDKMVFGFFQLHVARS